MGLSLFKRAHRTVGYDLGGSSIKIAAIDAVKGEAVVRQLVAMPMEADLITDGMLFDPPGVSERLRRTLNIVDLRTASVVTAARCGREGLIKVADVPRESHEKARAALATDKTLGLPIQDDPVFDLVLLDPEGESAIMPVVAVAAKRDLIRQRQKVFSDALIHLSVVDLDAFALFNVLRHCLPDQAAESGLILNIGHRTSIITVIENGVMILARQTTVGTRHLLDDVGAGGRGGAEAEEDILGSDELQSMHPAAFATWVDHIALDLRQAYDQAHGEDRSASRMPPVHITGGGSLVAGFKNGLGKALDARVEVLNPLNHMKVDEEVRQNHQASGPVFAIALGLALRDDA